MIKIMVMMMMIIMIMIMIIIIIMMAVMKDSRIVARNCINGEEAGG